MESVPTSPAGPIPYTGCSLDRAAQMRSDPAWVAARLLDRQTRFVPVWNNRNLVSDPDRPQPCFLMGEQASLALELADEVVLLGLQDGAAIFAIDLSPLEEVEAHQAVGDGATFRDLREVGPNMAQGDGALMAYARALVHWHGHHQYCPRCGQPNESKDAGFARICCGRQCGTTQFPRTDPAVIMLVHDGGEHCVLGRHARFPPGMHSTLAGFVEPGECLEEAVVREVKEEVGITVPLEGVRYFASQPWPFPASLMLGFHAACECLPLTVDEAELVGARWFHRDELLNAPGDETLSLPRKDSIARKLIEAWLHGQA
ncbi:NAD(+) diphosphatase [Rhodovibrio salinarum]|uniref:NAD(+) diphosphatase n=3 Tax=Alphaproteobacteria TaxID=28211 RepID=A0A934QF41_9PROT|nr:NAD(+) diphosphatase [Rhodovibrio salinarum]